MVTIDQVQHWYLMEGKIGHAVAAMGNGQVFTACGTISFDYESKTQPTPPKRICRKCRERLKVATLLGPAAIQSPTTN